MPESRPRVRRPLVHSLRTSRACSRRALRPRHRSGSPTFCKPFTPRMNSIHDVNGLQARSVSNPADTARTRSFGSIRISLRCVPSPSDPALCARPKSLPSPCSPGVPMAADPEHGSSVSSSCKAQARRLRSSKAGPQSRHRPALPSGQPPGNGAPGGLKTSASGASPAAWGPPGGVWGGRKTKAVLPRSPDFRKAGLLGRTDLYKSGLPRSPDRRPPVRPALGGSQPCPCTLSCSRS